MNFVEKFLEDIVNFLVSAANELSHLFIETVRRTLRAIRSLSIIALFFTALILCLSCSLGMCFAGHMWVVRVTGWVLLVLTLLTLWAAFLRVRSAPPNAQHKHAMGIPLLLVNLILVMGNYFAWAEHPFSSPINYLGLADSGVSQPIKRPPVIQLSQHGSAPKKQEQVAQASPVFLKAAGDPKTTNIEERDQPADLPSCGDPATADYAPVRRLKKVEPVRPANSGEVGGTVELQGKIDTYGRIRDLVVSSSILPPEFGEEALRAVNQWQYEPALLQGKPTTCAATITVDFQAGWR